ncbi:MAG TPA: protein translocase subunit SecF, partial [Thermoanaerobaculia bacterium]|nr:protein translocase subunit SecF [Thermoanaerobaculia bacterium]
MDLFRDSKIDFMKYRKGWVVVSIILVLVGIFSVFVHGKLNIGIDFAGGTQLTLKFAEEPEINRLRQILADAGLDAQLQRFGEAGANEVLIKTPVAEATEEGTRDRVVAALEAVYNTDSQATFDLNRDGVQDLASLLLQADPDGVGSGEEAAAHYEAVADQVIELRREEGLIPGWDALERADGVSPAAVAALREQAELGRFAVLGVENVGPQMGRELSRKGVLAVVLSLLGMLAYIWLRFELRFGIGALMASVHDVLIALGLFALAGFEFNLTTIAAFLTLVGYSVNDTVVIFDRIRENMRRSPTKPMIEVMNESLNQTLSRTLLTSGTTLVAVASLLALGGDVLRGFAFVLTVGVFVGTYSSIYIASPFALLWESVFGPGARSARRGKSG